MLRANAKALDASARVSTRENVRLTFDQKVEDVIQEIVDSNFELYKRITDDRIFGESIKNLLFDIYLRTFAADRAPLSCLWLISSSISGLGLCGVPLLRAATSENEASVGDLSSDFRRAVCLISCQLSFASPSAE
jgi:hypothetical protein